MEKMLQLHFIQFLGVPIIVADMVLLKIIIS